MCQKKEYGQLFGLLAHDPNLINEIAPIYFEHVLEEPSLTPHQMRLDRLSDQIIGKHCPKAKAALISFLLKTDPDTDRAGELLLSEKKDTTENFVLPRIEYYGLIDDEAGLIQLCKRKWFPLSHSEPQSSLLPTDFGLNISPLQSVALEI